MIFKLFDIHGNGIEPQNIISYELISEAGAPCDGLRLNFIAEEFIDEIVVVKAYSGSTLIFNGFCDKQKISVTKSGKTCFIYARSSAALLVDNEAVPCQYSGPSARQLWFSNAKALGFKCLLPEIYSNQNYLISKGTSCYGAINNYIFPACGAPVYATPQNELKVYEMSKKVKYLSSYRVTSLSYVINRCEPISDIDYKINSADNYSYHFKSEFAHKMGISRKRLLNLSSYPLSQRETAAKKSINASLDEYYTIHAEIAGECDLQVFDRIIADFDILNGSREFYVDETVKSKNENGEKTAVVLKKKINGELINYVA